MSPAVIAAQAVRARLAHLLSDWLAEHPEQRGTLLGDEAGVRVLCAPDLMPGAAVIYIPPRVAAREFDSTNPSDAAVLAAEVVFPRDTVGQVHEKIDKHLQGGVRLVWVIHPHDRTVIMYRRSRPPEMVNASQELFGDPELPGFRVSVAQLFV
jgi:Uma2 family endonuclease